MDGAAESYASGVLSRLHVPGLVLLALGAVLVYGASPITKRIRPEGNEKLVLLLKGVGCAIALAGTLLILELIG